MSQSTIRRLARQYLDGTIDGAEYRRRRREFIEAFERNRGLGVDTIQPDGSRGNSAHASGDAGGAGMQQGIFGAVPLEIQPQADDLTLALLSGAHAAPSSLEDTVSSDDEVLLATATTDEPGVAGAPARAPANVGDAESGVATEAAKSPAASRAARSEDGALARQDSEVTGLADRDAGVVEASGRAEEAVAEPAASEPRRHRPLLLVLVLTLTAVFCVYRFDPQLLWISSFLEQYLGPLP